MGAVNDAMIWLAENFTGLFNAAGQQFASFITSMIPMLVCLILTIKALIALIGEERVYGFMKKCTKYAVLRYTLIPFLCTFFLCNPMAYTFGVFVEEKYKPAFYDAVVSMMHPITGLSPMLTRRSCSSGSESRRDMRQWEGTPLLSPFASFSWDLSSA